MLAEKGVSLVTADHIQQVVDNCRIFTDFIKEGLIEYLDVNEENDSMIALYEKFITPQTTHLEIDPLTIMGACAGLIPNPVIRTKSVSPYFPCCRPRSAVLGLDRGSLLRIPESAFLFSPTHTHAHTQFMLGRSDACLALDAESEGDIRI